MLMSARSVALVAGMVASVTPAPGQETTRWKTPTPSQASVEVQKPVANPDSTFKPQEIGLVTRGTALIGKTIQDQDGHPVGKLGDLILDLPSGRVLGCLVAPREDNEVVVVPATSFFPVSEERIVYTGDKRAFRTARALPRGSNQTAFDTSTLNEAFQNFGQKPPELTAHLAPLTTLSMLKKSVLSQDNQSLGEVADVVANVSKGEVVYVIVKPKLGGEFYAVPPRAFDSKQGTTLLLKANQEKFLAGPHFPEKFWTELAMPSFASSVYGYYGLLGAAGTNEGTNTTSQIGLTPTGRSDQELREAFLSEMVNTAAMPAVRAKHLQFSVDQGRITLFGTVPSEKAKRELIAAAEKVAGPTKVTDQLKVR